jgi:hypothetical protein
MAVPLEAAALRAAIQRKKVQETMASRIPATMASPPREMPVVMLKPSSCRLVSWTKVAMSSCAEATEWCSLRFTTAWAAFNTAERLVPQTESLNNFLERHGVDLQQIDNDQKAMLEEEFTLQEVKQAIQEANEVSAPGPSGQTFAFFKLLQASSSLSRLGVASGLYTVSQLLEINDLTGRLTMEENRALFEDLAVYPHLQHKLRLFVRVFRRGPITDKFNCQVTAASSLFLVDKNLSQIFRKQL